MPFTDFVIKYDPKKDTIEDLSKRILYVLFLKRLKYKKPAITFISGDSGEGKSMASLAIIDTLMEILEKDLVEYMNDVNVYVPIEYPQKIDGLLHDKRLKKIPFIVVHEAREVVRAKLWNSFLTQSIADINAMSRSIKRLAIFIVSQFIRDITTDVRYTINYYIKAHRPMGNNRRTRLQFYVMWKDDRDLEKPRLRKRRVSGYLRYPSGKMRRYTPRYIEVRMPRKEIAQVFDKQDTAAKAKVIKHKLQKLMQEMEKDMDIQTDKVQVMADWYLMHSDNLQIIGKRYKGKWKLKPEVATMHGLTPSEIQQFQEKLNIALKERGYFDATQQSPPKTTSEQIDEDEVEDKERLDGEE